MIRAARRRRLERWTRRRRLVYRQGVPERLTTASTSPDRLDPAQLRVRFRPGEPAYALFGRLAARNVETSCRAFAKRHGLRFDIDVVGGHAIGQVARLAGLPEADVARHTVTRIGKRWVTLNGEHLKAGAWWPARRFCPECLRDDLTGTDELDGPRESRPFRRSWWDVRLFDNCPLHLVRLASRCCSCGKRPDIDQASPWRCRCSADLTASRPARASAAECGFERYLVGRLGGASRVTLPILDELPLMAAEEIAYHLGRMAADDIVGCFGWETARRSSYRRTGFSVLALGDERLLRLLGSFVTPRHAATVRDLSAAVRAGLSPEHLPALDALAYEASVRRPEAAPSSIKVPLTSRRPGGQKRPSKLQDRSVDQPEKALLTFEEAAAFCWIGQRFFRFVVTAGLIAVVGRGRSARIPTSSCVAFTGRYATSPWLSRQHGIGGKSLLRLLRDARVKPVASLPAGGLVFLRDEAETALNAIAGADTVAVRPQAASR